MSLPRAELDYVAPARRPRVAGIARRWERPPIRLAFATAVATMRVPAEVFLDPPYDPSMSRIKS